MLPKFEGESILLDIAFSVCEGSVAATLFSWSGEEPVLPFSLYKWIFPKVACAVDFDVSE